MRKKPVTVAFDPTKPKPVDEKDGPPAKDMEKYDRHLKQAFELEALTSQLSWSWFFGGMLADSAAAAKALKSCEKMNDVIRCQATIAYVESQLKKLADAAQALNDQRARYPLFAKDYPYRADFDELTGRITVIKLSPEDLGVDPPAEDPTTSEEASGGEDSTSGPGNEQPAVLDPEDGNGETVDPPADPLEEEEEDPSRGAGEPGDPFDEEDE